jgi:DNA-binding transcriptional regulator LsrR (DeoR family)
MARDITSDQIVDAAKDLDKAEFTRAQVAEKLGVKTTDLKQGFKEARESNRIEKLRDDEQGTGQFRLTTE